MLTLFALGRIHYYYDKARCEEPDARGPYDSGHAAVAMAVRQQIFASVTPEMQARYKVIYNRLRTDPRAAAMETGLDQACYDILPKDKWPKLEVAIPAGA